MRGGAWNLRARFARSTEGPPGARLRIAAVLAILAATLLGVGWASQPAGPPRLHERASPQIPDSLRPLGLSGWVVVFVDLDSAGVVLDARAVDPEDSDYFFGPHARAFEQASLAAARGYRFAPEPGHTAAGTWAVPVRFGPPADTSAAAANGTLVGEVRDAKGRRLGKVGACAPGLRRATLTAADGGYRLAGLPPGRHEVVFSAAGHRPARRALVVRAGATDTLRLVLRPCAECRRERCFAIPARVAQ